VTNKKFIDFKKGYLVIGRADGQGVKIGDDVEVILKRKEGNDYLCIKAPGKKVLRLEIVDKPPRNKGVGSE